MNEDFPFIGAAITPDPAEDLPTFAQPAWNFATDKFIYDGNGNHKIVYENEAIKVWCYKALKTERFSYMAYSWRYGIELYPFIGNVMSVQERYSELKRVITECLMVNPYIVSIDAIEFEPDNKGNTVNTRIELTTIYGKEELNV